MGRSHCWLASTMSGTSSPICSRTALKRCTSILLSGWPTLILMPPMPSASDWLARSFTSWMGACRKPPEVL